jgi:hypothetical protein
MVKIGLTSSMVFLAIDVLIVLKARFIALRICFDVPLGEQHLLQNSKDDRVVVPAINQVEFHPFLYQNELLQFCKNNNIQLEAYSPLTRGKRLITMRL